MKPLFKISGKYGSLDIKKSLFLQTLSIFEGASGTAGVLYIYKIKPVPRKHFPSAKDGTSLIVYFDTQDIYNSMIL